MSRLLRDPGESYRGKGFSPMLMRRNRMRKTLRTGSTAAERAATIFLRDLTRPKMRMTRRARRMRTIWLELLDRTVERRLETTTIVSDRLQTLVRKGLSQLQKRLTASSAVKITVKARFMRLMRRLRLARLGPSCGAGLWLSKLSPLRYWDSSTVQAKL